MSWQSWGKLEDCLSHSCVMNLLSLWGNTPGLLALRLVPALWNIKNKTYPLFIFWNSLCILFSPLSMFRRKDGLLFQICTAVESFLFSSKTLSPIPSFIKMVSVVNTVFLQGLSCSLSLVFQNDTEALKNPVLYLQSSNWEFREAWRRVLKLLEGETHTPLGGGKCLPLWGCSWWASRSGDF